MKNQINYTIVILPIALHKMEIMEDIFPNNIRNTINRIALITATYNKDNLNMIKIVISINLIIMNQNSSNKIIINLAKCSNNTSNRTTKMNNKIII